MNCDRAQEFFSDLVEGTLAAPLEREVETHLEGCPECLSLSTSMREAVTRLRGLSAVEPPTDLAERVLARTLPVLRRERARAAATSPVATAPTTPTSPPAWTWLAAAAAIVLLLAWRPPAFAREFSREASQGAYRVYSFGVRTYHETERWVEDLNVLRMTVGVAFEDRLDHLTERLRDLDEARRRETSEGDDERDESSSSKSLRPALMAFISSRSFS